MIDLRHHLLFCVALIGTPVWAAPLSYNRDIRPILSDNCFACHGPDKANQKAGLRLDVREQALKPAKSGDVAIVPGDAAKSTLIIRIESTDEDEIMPPLKAHKTISKAQKDKLRQWITEGAVYEKHWSFIPLATVTKPVVKNTNWPRNDIDHFILARQETEGLHPSPETSKAALIRRVTLDLTGLPPTRAEVEAFLADSSPQAYERVVDRLLKSPHYGERMAVDWLDAARYADSNGYQVDRDRELWPWRDWVIKAFNDNKRFDQFTIEQLAGDLLPNATLEQKIATGFHRNHMLNEEGGVLADEFLAEYTADRVETTAAVWLGQTFNCARCHDHKYDPFTQRDFYSMKAFFHNVPEKGVGIYNNPIRINAPPFVKLPAPEVDAKIATLNTQLKNTNDAIAALAKASQDGVEAWAKRIAGAKITWSPVPASSASGGDQPPVIDKSTGSVTIGPQETRANNIKLTLPIKARKVTAIQLECSTTAPAASFQWSELHLSLSGKKKTPVTLRAAAAGDSFDPAKLVNVLDNDRKTKAPLSIAPAKPVRAVFELTSPLNIDQKGTELILTIGVENAGGPSQWRVMTTDVPAELLAPAAVAAIALKEPMKRSQPEADQLAAFKVTQLPKHRELTDKLAALKKEIATTELEIPTTLVMDEMKEIRPTFVLMRGAYDKPGEKVSAATPAVLPALDKGLPHNRLGFARWLVSPANPLTARVTVNRFWQQVFGTGLVKTSEDFGAQGALPSHPELLDWLALEFIRTGWDVKHLMKLMVTSATYRQQSHLTPALQQHDPENRMLARGPRVRLMGEFVRDQALAVAGLLVEKTGGPSVKPYHPAGLYEQITAGNGYNVYVPGKGDDLHRRSLYTYWKRSVPHPAMLLFDAPFRETCTLRRPRTNTPLQALNLLNDPTYAEASRFLAQRMIKEGGKDAAARLKHGFRLLLVRDPKPEEIALLTRALERSLAAYKADPKAAAALLEVGDAKTDTAINPVELAAFTTIASTLLNLDETITKP